MANSTRFGTGEARLKAMSEANYPNGVVVDPAPITAGQEVTIFYNGLLDQSGAGDVYLHYGFGLEQDWYEVYDTRMERTGWGWVSNITVQNYEGRLNFCFKDGADHWDNNNGANWSFQIHDGSRRY